MKSNIKRKLVALVEKIHLQVFGHEISPQMRFFLGNLSWSFVTGIFIMPLVMIINMLAGRFIGPIEYGKYSLLLVVNQFLTMIIFFGLDTTSVKFIAKAESFEEKRKVISSNSKFVFSMLGLLVGLSILLSFIFLRFSKEYSIFALLIAYYTLVITLKLTLDLFIRGIEDFKSQAKGKMIEAAVLICSFIVVFVALNRKSFISFVLIVTIAALMISSYYFSKLRKFFSKSDRKILQKQLSESKLFFISTVVTTLFILADRLVIGKTLGIKILGIYSAYYLGSFTLISQITQLFTNVFLPASSRIKNKSFAGKIDKLFVLGFVPFFILSSGMLLLVLLVLGRQYPLNPSYIVGFSIFSTLFFFQSLYNTVIIDAPRIQYKKYITEIGLVCLLTVVVYLVSALIHIVSIPLILSALILNALISIFIERKFIKSMQSS